MNAKNEKDLEVNDESSRKRGFTVEDSQKMKGIAIVLLMFHHLFGKDKYFENIAVSFIPFSQDQLVNLAYCSKICVAIFAFISGYGLYLNRKKSTLKPFEWAKERYIKTFSGYWFVYLLSFLTGIYRSRTIKTYASENYIQSVFYGIVDFFGLSNLIGTPTLNRTWWYMSAIFCYICLMACYTEKVRNVVEPKIVLLLTMMIPRMILGFRGGNYPGQNSELAFFPAFVLGAVFAEYHVFEKVRSHHQVLLFFAYILVMLLCYILYINIPYGMFWEIHFLFIPMIFILFFYRYVLMLPIITDILWFLGKHSMNIFLTHTFISGTYFHKYIYMCHHWLFILLALSISSIALSMLINKAKEVLKYNVFIYRLISTPKSK